MARFTVSAPGKVILYGEHAVVYGKTAIAASLDLRTTLTFRELPETEESCLLTFLKVNTNQKAVPLKQIKEFLCINEKAVTPNDHDTLYNSTQQFVQQIGYSGVQQKLSLEVFFYMLSYMIRTESIDFKPFEVTLTTSLSISSGLGSSASFAVCLAATFLNWSRLQHNTQKNFDTDDLDKISRYAHVCERLIHGNPSGIDNSICTYGSIIEFRKGEDIKLISGIKSMKILLVDTRVQRSTKVLLHRLMELKRQYPAIIDPILDSIDNVSKEAIDVLKKLRYLYNDDTSLNEEYRKLMVLINLNQGLLATCQVSHPSLDRICAEAHNYGLAAKLTGAGGGGYAYILLMPDTQPETISSISRKLIADGYSVTLTSLGCDGVKLST